jgi:hypothetical protein
MENVESKFMEGTVRETYSDAAVAKAASKYSFAFKIGGVVSHAGYDPQKDRLYIEGPATGSEFIALAEKVEALIDSKADDLAPLDVRKFLCKHLRATIKVEQELQRTPLSERPFELLDSKPIGMNDLPLEHQCILEVLQEQSEKANQAAIANGTPDDVKYEITAEMVEAKMKEKSVQPK